MKLYFKLYAMMDHNPNHVDTFKRFVAFGVDWFLGYMCCFLPIAVIFLYNEKGSNDLVSDLAMLGNRVGPQAAYLAAFLCFLIAIFYYVIVPLKIYPGQTFGKRFMGLKMVKVNGQPIDLKALLLRQVLAMIVLEGYLCYGVSENLRQVFAVAGFPIVTLVLSFIAILISAISIFLCYKFESHRALHDYIAKTKVVIANEEEKKA